MESNNLLSVDKFNKQSSKYPCPCCGYLVFSEPSGSYQICPICFWEDEYYQLQSPEIADGANHGVSLVEGQENFIRYGACSKNCLKYVRKPVASDLKDLGWRRYDRTLDSNWVGSMEQPYYWRKKSST